MIFIYHLHTNILFFNPDVQWSQLLAALLDYQRVIKSRTFFIKMSLKYQEDIDDGTTKYDYDLIVIGGGSGGMCFN